MGILGVRLVMIRVEIYPLRLGVLVKTVIRIRQIKGILGVGIVIIGAEIYPLRLEVVTTWDRIQL